MQTRFIYTIGTQAFLRVFWTGECGTSSYHNAMAHLTNSGTYPDNELGGDPSDHPNESWPKICEDCGAAPGPDVTRQVFRKRLYGTIGGSSWEGDPQPGDMYYETWCTKLQQCHSGWSNCDGQHLTVVLPNGHTWDTNGRASNCGSREEKTHRCWVRHGLPENGERVNVDKVGHTCSAGGGSIDAFGWHGFLTNGELNKC